MRHPWLSLANCSSILPLRLEEDTVRHSIRNLLVALAVVVTSSAAFAQIGITVAFGPPALPVYEQPVCPEVGWLWTPGYWAWDPNYGDYYWVPGTWVEAPEIGYLWTPAWWGWGGSGFIFHEGFWGPRVGFYGGIDYGFGYFGNGFEGGRWQGNQFFYNRAVVNVNVNIIHNVYNTTVVHNTVINRVSYNGGEGGLTARATPEELQVDKERHLPPSAAQLQHFQAARNNPQLRASANQGKPSIAATARPGAFQGEGVVHAQEAGAPYHPSTTLHGGPARPVHAGDLQPHQAPQPNTGNADLDQKYQQQQNQLIQKQNQQHAQLQQRQDADHARMTQQNASDFQKNQMEQRHQQQTYQMEQRHTQQENHLQQRQPEAHYEGRPR
jgi:WXXGXW repeat (2 copies)